VFEIAQGSQERTGRDGGRLCPQHRSRERHDGQIDRPFGVRPATLGTHQHNRVVERDRFSTEISARRSGQAYDILERADRVHDREPGPPTLYDCLASHSFKPLLILRCLGIVPSHHRPLGGKRANVVDTEFDELLHNQLGTTPLDQRKRDTEPRRRRRDLDDFTGRLDRCSPTARPPAPGPITDSYRFTVAQTQHTAKVMAIVVSDDGNLDRLDQDVRALLTVRRDARHERLRRRRT